MLRRKKTHPHRWEVGLWEELADAAAARMGMEWILDSKDKFINILNWHFSLLDCPLPWLLHEIYHSSACTESKQLYPEAVQWQQSTVHRLCKSWIMLAPIPPFSFQLIFNFGPAAAEPRFRIKTENCELYKIRQNFSGQLVMGKKVESWYSWSTTR